MIGPHGGRLVDRHVSAEYGQQLRETVSDQPTVRLTRNQYQAFVNIATGRFSPLTGFLTRNDFRKVVHDMALEDGTVWPLPVTLDVSSETADDLVPGTKVALARPDGAVVGAMDVEEVYRHNRQETVAAVYGTDDPDHPGVAHYLDRGEFFVGGDVYQFEETRYNDHDLYPAETRVLFRERGWDTVAGFQTRNAPHRAHEYIQKATLESVDGLLIQPKLGEKKAEDYRDRTIMGAYETLIDGYYPRSTVALSVFPSKMRYAGPREAVFDALVRKNQGCTHFIVGRDHAGVGDYYDEFGAQRVVEEVGDIGIEPVFYDYAFYCDTCDGMGSAKTCPHGEAAKTHPSGTAIREAIRAGDRPDERVMRPEVAAYIADRDRPFVGEAEALGGEVS